MMNQFSYQVVVFDYPTFPVKVQDRMRHHQIPELMYQQDEFLKNHKPVLDLHQNKPIVGNEVHEPNLLLNQEFQKRMIHFLVL